MLRALSLPLLSFCLFALSLPACAPYRAAWGSGWTEKEANDSIMIVDSSPATLGWKRLQYFTTLHPEFGTFLKQFGTPDCIAETTHSRQHYLVAYYLNNRQAYSFRNNTKAISQPIEVAGPYPMSPKEYRLLRSLQKDFERSSSPD
jgi:hypothetical protein